MSSGALPVAGRAARSSAAAWRVLAIIVAVVALAVVADAVRVALTLRDLQRATAVLLANAQALGTEPARWTPGGLDAAAKAGRQEAPRIDADVASLHSDPLLRLGLMLPWTSAGVTAVLDLGDAAQASAASIPDLVAVGRAYLVATHGTGAPGPRILSFLQQAADPASTASGRLQSPVARLHTDQSQPLPGALKQEVDRAYRELAPLAAGVDLFAQAGGQLPAALGATSPQPYLILFPNPTEIRPTGGFSGVVGGLSISKGDAKVHFIPIDDLVPLYRDHFEVPYELGRFLHYPNNSLDISDSGWDPDFPTSAQLAERMYRSATGITPAGTISVDPDVVAALLKITGPVSVPTYGEFNSQNLTAQLNYIANVDPTHNGVPSLAPVGDALFNKLLTAPPSDWPAMAAVLQSAVAGRHLMVHLVNPSLQSLAASAGASGAIAHPPENVDYLMPVQANVGGTKGDAYVTKKMDVKVERYPAGIARHEVTISFQYPVLTDPVALHLNKHPYRNYLRFYLPETASVRAIYQYADGKPSTDNFIDNVTLEDGHRVAATVVQLNPGHSVEVHLYYEVPFGDDTAYTLFLQKQAGIPDLPTTVEISYPGSVYKGSTQLTADSTFEVHW